jgi:hypothetical protein
MIPSILVILPWLTEEKLLNPGALFMNGTFFLGVPFPSPVQGVVVNELVGILHPS